jgi:PemK-like, MazF-like toxin of type II toxin-antitoxin system
MKGKIILVPFPFTNLKSSKKRPCLVLYERPLDVLVAFISSVIPAKIESNGVLIQPSHPEFFKTGLKKESIIYIDKLATLSKKLVLGELGEIGKKLKRKINRAIRKNIKI